ncbi:MAG: homoserine dehydrogenase [Lachnospiraceae bacterium]|jgi:homoserine dehydrogenase|nr:homoserine dehydrogenase [uncultured Oribacterium sp.]MBF0983036.1 homoserine dehydrogenase [Lachnospiraceae bacterium]
MKIAIMGFGTVGSGVKEVLELNRAQIEKKGGEKIEIKYILSRHEHIQGVPDELITTDFATIENDPEVELVVEAIGGIHPAYEYIKSCLEKGKHVVSSNKAVVDACGSKLVRTAKEHDRNFYFEASVGGGIPVIRTLYHNYAGENVTEITGILNGTSNFILSKMKDEGSTFAETLKEAQRLGYAEKDPSADVDGFDTSRKTAILLSMSSGMRCRHEDIYTEGIRNVSDIDMAYARKMGYHIRLLGSVETVEEQYFAYVAPIMVGEDDPLYFVNGVYNGIRIVGNCLGNTMLYGKGAGKLPTASAVVSDIIAAARHKDHFQGIGWSEKMLTIEPMGANAFRYFLRIEGTAQGIEKDLSAFFLSEGETLSPVVLDGRTDEFALVSTLLFEEDFLERLQAFEEASGRRVFHFIRVKKMLED